MMQKVFDYESALAAFAKRFTGYVDEDDIRHRFDVLLSRGALDIGRRSDGSLRVSLTSPKVNVWWPTR
jgi:hypothetical protein